jgi:prepilin signal peptidase PulO-like enzyme (type II secretory pathway)
LTVATGSLFAILGLIGGSFATAVSHRLISGESIVTDRSRCPHCHHVLGAVDLVPLVSWLWRRGRCGYCRERISWRYPAIELAALALFVIAWRQQPDSLIVAALLALTALGLLIIVVVDLEAGIIPDAMLIILTPVALVWRWMSLANAGTFAPWLDAALGAAIGFGALFAVREIFRRLRGVEGMGFGDVKFAALAGFYVGLAGLPIFMVVSGSLGIFFGLAWRIAGKGSKFPFGPALCAALILMLMLPGVFRWP